MGVHPLLRLTLSPILRFPGSPSRSIHVHARHARERCYDPDIVASFPDAREFARANPRFAADTEDRSPAPVPKITKPTPLRFDIAREQPPGREFPIPRVSVFIYVDGVMVERFLSGYAPFTWIVDPARIAPGEHVVTGVFAWRDDHFGIAHARVWVEKERETASR